MHRNANFFVVFSEILFSLLLHAIATKSTVTAQVLPPPAPGGSAVGSRPRQSESLSESQFSSLLSAMQDSERRLDRKLADFTSDDRQMQDEAATKAVNRVQRENLISSSVKPTKSKRGSTRRSRRAYARLSTLSLSSTTLRPSSAPKRHWKKVLKLIKIADRSANGWGVVAEYTADELADDSEDEKRLEKAEKAAEGKVGLKKRKRVQPAARPSPRLPRYAPYGGYAYPLQQQQQQQQQQHQQPGPSHNLGSRSLGPHTGPVNQRAVGPCFACGEMGHLRTYCPKMQSQVKKWYPSQMLMHESVPVVGVPGVCEVMMRGRGRVECCGSASSCMGRDVLAGGSPTTPSVGVTSFPPPFETSTISMVMEDVVKIDPGNLSVSMAMGDVV